jgi:hypothetical protein
MAYFLSGALVIEELIVFMTQGQNMYLSLCLGKCLRLLRIVSVMIDDIRYIQRLILLYTGFGFLYSSMEHTVKQDSSRSARH